MRNLINADDIGRFLHEHAGPDERLGQLLTQTLCRALQKEDDIHRRVMEWPEAAPSWLTEEKFKKGVYAFDGARLRSHYFLSDAVDYVTEWLRWAIQFDEPWLQRLNAKGDVARLASIGTLGQALRTAQRDLVRWIAKCDVPKPRAERAIDPWKTHLRTVLLLDDGFSWVEIRTPLALSEEARLMRNCLRNQMYADQLTAGTSRFFSLRNRANRPVVTLQCVQDLPYAVAGKCNASPEPYFDKIAALVRKHEWKLSTSCSATGRFHLLGCVMNLESLPEGFALVSSLKVQGAPVSVLPLDLSIEGDLELAELPHLDFIPAGLMVEGSLSVSHCPLITMLPQGVEVGGNVRIQDCSGFRNLAPLVHVTGNLVIEGCSSFEALPSKLRVDGNLVLIDNQVLSFVPDNITVGGDVIIGDCPRISLPSQLRVGGRVMLRPPSPYAKMRQEIQLAREARQKLIASSPDAKPGDGGCGGAPPQTPTSGSAPRRRLH